MQPTAIGIIPARYASSRFPGKPLAMIGGKSMINRVYEQASKCTLLQKVVVATDDKRIASYVESFGGQVVMTATNHSSGTSRIGEAYAKIVKNDVSEPPQVVVNIQGDEPFINPEQISGLIRIFENAEVQIATLVKKIENPSDLLNPNVVKVVTAQSGKALYFSRSAIPFMRGVAVEHWLERQDYYKHIGLYAYRAAVLPVLNSLSPSAAELAESLEQLRWLAHGFDIFTAVTDIETIGIDTPEDLSKVTNNI